jgi:hypothetical protein
MKNKNIGTFTIDVELQENGLYDVWLAHEGSSGDHYKDTTLERIGPLVTDLIDCVVEAF